MVKVKKYEMLLRKMMIYSKDHRVPLLFPSGKIELTIFSDLVCLFLSRVMPNYLKVFYTVRDPE